ncbi:MULTISPECIES: flagellar hook capping FlgD N-terminal domain-containing protein [unclassified Paracoccus (in: a-proteobacteria)]|uniref:flagellar hook capping FlgD N-terminal domain-containing protein n=1 Tax=unclassified Paracoccus (in: a-proteobacteria) TaxID=2688777 RepID=UPI0012B3C179|nr:MULTISPECIES: flagellar hook capping FlgD N-terminal domain-containing protein [unclassified Paracoccus (in: a-proteobacteria)]UXU75360.1 flagellar basal body rod modification protein [Paracoccus sp. SMMA_5]UXU81264.1 flagellar basal body rod modification protein [Paracoccus sp. SMMA_5_TC]
MSTIESLLSTPRSSSPSLGTGTVTSAATGQFETFLKMLTAQIKNQDPLNPMQSTDFAVQLATFSGVEQQVRTNQLLESLLAGSQSDLAAFSSWIGMQARTTAPVAVADEEITLEHGDIRAGDEAWLLVLDSQGKEVARSQVRREQTSMVWSRLDHADTNLPAGKYAFRIEMRQGGDVIGYRPVSVPTVITGVEATDTGVNLLLQGGGSARPAEITRLTGRSP